MNEKDRKKIIDEMNRIKAEVFLKSLTVEKDKPVQTKYETSKIYNKNKTSIK